MILTLERLLLKVVKLTLIARHKEVMEKPMVLV